MPEYQGLIHFHNYCYIAISNDLASSLDILIELPSLEALLTNTFFLPNTFIFAYDEKYENQLNTPEFDYKLLSQIQNDIQIKNIIGLRHGLELFYTKYHNKNNISQMYVKFAFSSFIRDIYAQLSTNEFDELSNTVQNIYKLNTFQDIWNQTIYVVEKYDTYLQQNTTSSSTPIELVKQYIENNYGNQNLVFKKIVY